MRHGDYSHPPQNSNSDEKLLLREQSVCKIYCNVGEWKLRSLKGHRKLKFWIRVTSGGDIRVTGVVWDEFQQKLFCDVEASLHSRQSGTKCSADECTINSLRHSSALHSLRTRPSNTGASQVGWKQRPSPPAAILASFQELPISVWRLPRIPRLLEESSLARRCGFRACTTAGGSCRGQSRPSENRADYFQTPRTRLWRPSVWKASCEKNSSPSAFLFARDRLCTNHASFWWIRVWFRNLPCNLELLQS